MTRVSIYSSAVVAFAAVTGMVLASIAIPNWVSYSVTTAKGERIQKTIGLHKSCSTLDDPSCTTFPTSELCQDGERYFCSMWKTVGFLASFAVLLCLGTLVSFGVTLAGGKYKRESGWPLVSGLLALVSVVEFVIISIVAYLYDNDGQFSIPGWRLDKSWYLSTVGATISLVTAIGMALSAYMLPPEEGYEFIDDPIDP